MKISFISKKNKTILGLILIKISCILFLSFISFLINNNNSKIQNALGKIGIIISNYLLYNGIGISIFLLPILLFFLGLKIFYKYINIKNIILHILFFIIWIPITLGFIFSNKIISGIFGLRIKSLLIYFIGKIGLFLIILNSILIYIIIIFKITYDKLFFKKFFF